MSDHACTTNFCDAVPIKVNRVFDSCCDKDCLKDVQICLDCGDLPGNICLVKSKCVRVADICMNVEPLPFNKGYYSVSLTYTFRVELYGYEKACDCPIVLTGTANASKSCILFGCESNTRTFFSNGMTVGSVNHCCDTVNLPTVAVQIVEPIALETRIGKSCVSEGKDGACCFRKSVCMTLGLFSVVELIRPTTILVPTYEYTIPHKECECEKDDPCEIFDKICFPIKEFAPDCQSECPCDCKCKCDCDCDCDCR